MAILNNESLDLITYPQNLSNKNIENRKDFKINTSLLMAVESGNYKDVDLILTYMAQVKQNNSFNFSQIFPKLLEYDRFQEYLTNLPI